MNDTPLPTRFVVDENGVNLANGYHYGSDTIVASIGTGAAQLSIHARDGANEDGLQAYNGAVNVSGSTYTVTIPGTSRAQESFVFTLSGSSYISSDGKGATLVNGSSGYVLTTADGTVYTYGFTVTSSGQPWYKARLTHVQLTNGSTLSLVWQDITYCTNNLDYCSGGTYLTKVRLQSVTSSYGYQIHYNYRSNDATTSNGGTNWDQLSKMVLLNLAVDYCDPNASTCTLTQSAATVTPTTSYSGSTYTFSFQDPMSRSTSYSSTTQNGTTSFVATYPDSSQTTVQLDTNGRVSSITRDGSTWTYSFSLSGTTMTATVTNPDGTHRTVVSDTTVGLPTSVTDELTHTISFSYDSYGRLSNSTTADGNSVHYTYDARGNVTQTDFIPKSGSGLATLTATANYPTSCTNTLTCNQPTWTKDTAQNETDYSYNERYDRSCCERHTTSGQWCKAAGSVQLHLCASRLQEQFGQPCFLWRADHCTIERLAMHEPGELFGNGR